jgi:hypothetical protein
LQLAATSCTVWLRRSTSLWLIAKLARTPFFA